MTSAKMRENDLFMRNSFQGQGKWDIPLVKSNYINTENLSLIACSDTRNHDSKTNCEKGVHFFVDDYRFNGVYNNPSRTLSKYSQYAFLLTPDFSTYADMNMWRQMESVAKNRWVGAYWQEHGLTVIPTISWSTALSFEFCFDGVEQNAVVAVGMIGCKHNRRGFMRGYDAMLEHLNPETILCFGSPFSEMRGNLITVDYISSRKVAR